ncbi:putative ribonuclease H-like domain-containing protein [Tanacetum coccineum]|uniref:Ribonuclease H-like domain-containing protein n=1 Tax=Tanacetum coccineum TaxID=301880 RepID=A0ABQ5ESJ7_9ASTR
MIYVAMKIEHYLEYIDNDVLEGNSVVENERKAKNILLMAIPKEHMRRFHGMDDAKEIWEAIRTRFGGNANSKKMQKALEAHGAEVSTEDANHKFLRSLPPAWCNLAMTMRTKPEVDTLSIDDLYNNLRVLLMKLSIPSLPKNQRTGTCFMKIFEQIDDLDIEEMDINWECTAKGTNDGKKKRDSFYQHQRSWSKRKESMWLADNRWMELSIGENIPEVEVTKSVLSAISSMFHTLDGDYTPTPQEEIDESLYVYGVKKGPQEPEPNVSDDRSSEYSTVKLNNTQMSHFHAVKGNWGSAVKTSTGYNWRNSNPNSNCDSGPTFIRTVNAKGPQGRPKPEKAWWKLRAHYRITGSTEEFEEFNIGSVRFGDTLSVLGKFDGKSDEGFLVGYSLNSKAYRVYNLVTKRVEVNLHVNFLKDKPNVKGVGYRWMFDIDYLTDCMNYIPVSLENQANQHAGASEVTNSAVPSTVRNTEEKAESRESSTNSKKEEILIDLQQEKKASSTDTSEDNPKILAFRRELEEIALKHLGKVTENTTTSTSSVNTGSEPVNTGSFDPDDSPMPELKIFHKSETRIFDKASYDEDGMITDFNSLPTEIEGSPTPTLRIYNIHPKSQILGDPKSAEPKKISEALQDDSWVQAMQEELLQFKLQQVWVLVDLPHRMKVIGTKWVYKNKRDERGVVVRNKERLVAQGYTQEEVKALYGLHQAHRAWYATLSTFLEKHGYKRGTIDKTLFIKRDKKDIMLVQVYVDDIIFGSTNKSWCDEFEALMKSRFQMSSMGELTFFLGLQVKQNKAGIFISQDKYVAEILKKFDLANVKTAITPMETKVALTKDEEAVDVELHLYRSMIGSLMYLTASMPDILFATPIPPNAKGKVASLHCQSSNLGPDAVTIRSKADRRAASKEHWARSKTRRDHVCIAKYSLDIPARVRRSNNSHWGSGTDIQKESQRRPNQARDGKDKVNPKPKSVKVKSQPHEENTT